MIHSDRSRKDDMLSLLDILFSEAVKAKEAENHISRSTTIPCHGVGVDYHPWDIVEF